jgi:tetratricopeptide (TPR) repeat protein
MNRGDVAMEYGDVNAALVSYGAAEALFPENEEMQYWHAVALANIGRVDDALPIFKRVFNKNSDWRELTPRIVKAGLLKVSQPDVERILNLK